MILDTYPVDAELLEYGAKHYPEIRFGYGSISLDNFSEYLEMIDKLKTLWIVNNTHNK